MEISFNEFKEAITIAEAHGMFPVEAKLVVHGRIEYVVERGDLTIAEGQRLENMLGSDFLDRYRPMFQIAAWGETDLKTTPQSPSRAYATAQ